MSNLSVVEVGGNFVVDSRLIAERLGIEHRSLMRSIDKYLGRLQARNQVRFEIAVAERPQGGTSETRFAYLDERQSMLLMTYSRNTDQVLDCKDELVDAFAEAKKIIATVIPAQSDRIRELELELALSESRERLAISAATLESFVPGLGALAMGKDVEVKITISAERHVIKDEKGRVVRDKESMALGTVAKQLGLKQAKHLRAFLESCGREDLIEPGEIIVPSDRIPTESIREIRKLWASKHGERQQVLGE